MAFTDRRLLRSSLLPREKRPTQVPPITITNESRNIQATVPKSASNKVNSIAQNYAYPPTKPPPRDLERIPDTIRPRVAHLCSGTDWSIKTSIVMSTESTQPPNSVINNVLNQEGIGTSQANASL
jgi:hypothetical protein